MGAEWATRNLDKFPADRPVYMFTDSQSVLQALVATTVDCQVIEQCITSLNALGSHRRVILRWIKGHEGHLGNVCSDIFANTGADLNARPEDSAYYPIKVPIPLARAKAQIKEYIRKVWIQGWKGQVSCRQSKLFMPEPDKKQD